MTTKSKTLLETTKATIGKEKYKMVIESQNHTIVGDEPKDGGGADLGMNPFSLLLAGLSSCTASTVKTFADRRNWPLDEAIINVKMEQVEENGVIGTEFTKEVQLHGALTDEQRRKLLDVAAHCAVHKILTGPIAINTVQPVAIHAGNN
jgi:putative redox protein